MSTLVHAAAISEPNSAGEPWLSDEPFRDVYVQRNVKTLRERFQSLKKGDWKLKEEKSPRENHVTFAGVFPDVQISRRLPAVGSERRSVDVPFALRFSSSSKPRRLWRPGCSGVGMTSFTCESRTPPPRPQLNDFPAAALTRPRERPPGPNWLDSVLLMVPRANVAKNSARLRITACHPASRGGQPDGWQRPGDSSRWLEMIKKNKWLVYFQYMQMEPGVLYFGWYK